MKKTYVVLGLGLFGKAIAEELSKNNLNVIGIDRDIDAVNEMSSVCETACLDFSNIENLKSVGVENADVAFVASGDRLDETILGIMNLKDLGVKRVIAKAKDDRSATVLQRVGADSIIMPERETGIRLAIKESSEGKIKELFELEGDSVIAEIKPMSGWIGMNLIELNLRSMYDINVIAIKNNNKFVSSVDPKRPFEETDVLLVIGTEASLKKMKKRM